MLSSFGLCILYLFLCSSVITVATNNVNRPTVGVIRRDASNFVNGKYDEISFYSHRALTPEHYHYRLPFFAKVNPDGNLTYNADSQEVMDQEILYAKFAGLDYCAFGPNCSTNSPYCIQCITFLITSSQTSMKTLALANAFNYSVNVNLQTSLYHKDESLRPNIECTCVFKRHFRY